MEQTGWCCCDWQERVYAFRHTRESTASFAPSAWSLFLDSTREPAVFNSLSCAPVYIKCSVLCVGEQTCCPGSPVGGGLTAEAAADLGLEPGTAVGASLIDAHAGGLGQLYSMIFCWLTSRGRVTKAQEICRGRVMKCTSILMFFVYFFRCHWSRCKWTSPAMWKSANHIAHCSDLWNIVLSHGREFRVNSISEH